MNRDVMCSWVIPQLSAYFDRRLDGVEHGEVEDHLKGCRVCSTRARSLESARARVHALPQRTAPSALRTRLRVMASHEASRRRSHGNVPALLRSWRDDARLWANNLMRPIAIPATGGVFTALLLFAMLAPSLTTRAQVSGADIPTVLSTEASVRSNMPFSFHQDAITLDLTIDEQGCVVEYAMADGTPLPKSPVVRRSIENYLLFTHFYPATAMGRPTMGRVRLTFVSSQIDVKG